MLRRGLTEKSGEGETEDHDGEKGRGTGGVCPSLDKRKGVPPIRVHETGTRVIMNEGWRRGYLGTFLDSHMKLGDRTVSADP